MQKTFNGRLLLFMIISIYVTGCQKDIKESTISRSSINAVKADHGNTIRLTSVSNEFVTQTFSYNNDGLMNQWHISGLEWTVNMEYTEDGRYDHSVIYVGSVLTYTVDFFYDKNRVVKEIWYDAGTGNVFDEVLYTYSPNGTLQRMESFVQHYYVVYQFSSDGDLMELKAYLNNIPLFKQTYTYNSHYKQPFRAIPGFEYAFIFFDGIYYQNKFYSTSISFTAYDGAGNELFEDAQNPDLTTFEAGPQNYPVAASFFNASSGSSINFLFTYENCGSCSSGKVNSNASSNSLRARLNKFLLRDPKVNIKDKAEELRADPGSYN